MSNSVVGNSNEDNPISDNLNRDNLVPGNSNDANSVSGNSISSPTTQSYQIILFLYLPIINRVNE